MHGLLCEARKLTHVAYLRRDPLVPELLNIARVPSQSSSLAFLCGLWIGGDEPALFSSVVALVC